MRTLIAAILAAAFLGSPALAGNAEDIEAIAMTTLGVTECYPELLGKPDTIKFVKQMVELMSKYPEAERYAVGKKVMAMIDQDKPRFCAAVADAVRPK